MKTVADMKLERKETEKGAYVIGEGWRLWLNKKDLALQLKLYGGLNTVNYISKSSTMYTNLMNEHFCHITKQ